jgi:hypothetical protein
MDMKYISSWLLLFMLVLLSGCEVPEATADNTESAPEVITYALEPDRSWEDTAYLYADYWNPGARVVVYVNGMPTCREAGFVPKVAGWVNTRLPGTYYLTYNATDLNGKALTAATKTVHVIENGAGFLNGNYDVTCNCTVTAAGSPGPTLTTITYTASSTSGSRNNHFQLSLLNIGADYGVSDAVLVGDAIEAGFCFSPDYQVIYLSGALAASKNSFTMESLIFRYTPRINYRCRNIYTRQLLIN